MQKTANTETFTIKIKIEDPKNTIGFTTTEELIKSLLQKSSIMSVISVQQTSK
jgi:hypothetical protein